MAAVHPSNMFFFHGLQDAPDPDYPEDWKFFFYVSFPTTLEWQDSARAWTNEQWLAEAKGRSTMCCDPWPLTFGSLDDAHVVWNIFMSDWDPSAEGCKWDTHDGRVTLAGDAAHAISFQRGQGLNHSVQDAANLWAQILRYIGPGTDSTQAEAIARYEEEMVERTGKETRLCTQNTEMVHDWSKAQQSPVFRIGSARA